MPMSSCCQVRDAVSVVAGGCFQVREGVPVVAMQALLDINIV